MEERSMEKALELAALLIQGKRVGARGENVALYEEYSSNSQMYDMLRLILKKFDLELYEYNDSLFVGAGENNRVFGFSNEELRKAVGVRVNKELFLCYFIIYNIMSEFYRTSESSTYAEFVRVEEIIRAVDGAFSGVLEHTADFTLNEVEENSFRTLALLWDELMVVSTEKFTMVKSAMEDMQGQRAGRSSKAGYVKLTFNFLISQGLFVENQDKYYPTDRFRALAQNYYSEKRGRLYEIISKKQTTGGMEIV